MCRENRYGWYWDEHSTTGKNIQNVQCTPTQGRLMEGYNAQPYKTPKYQQYTNFPKIKEPSQTSRWQKVDTHQVP
jgi:hypothetical protein